MSWKKQAAQSACGRAGGDYRPFNGPQGCTLIDIHQADLSCPQHRPDYMKKRSK
jgi:hypothetical protein